MNNQHLTQEMVEAYLNDDAVDLVLHPSDRAFREFELAVFEFHKRGFDTLKYLRTHAELKDGWKGYSGVGGNGT